MVLLMPSKFIRKQAFYYLLDDEAKLRVHPLLIHAYEVVATINVRFIYLKLLINMSCILVSNSAFLIT